MANDDAFENAFENAATSKSCDATVARSEATAGMKELADSTAAYNQARKSGMRDKDTAQHLGQQPVFFDSSTECASKDQPAVAQATNAVESMLGGLSGLFHGIEHSLGGIVNAVEHEVPVIGNAIGQFVHSIEGALSPVKEVLDDPHVVGLINDGAGFFQVADNVAGLQNVIVTGDAAVSQTNAATGDPGQASKIGEEIQKDSDSNESERIRIIQEQQNKVFEVEQEILKNLKTKTLQKGTKLS